MKPQEIEENYPQTKKELKRYERYKELVFVFLTTAEPEYEELKELSVEMVSLYGEAFVESVWIATASTIWDDMRQALDFRKSEENE